MCSDDDSAGADAGDVLPHCYSTKTKNTITLPNQVHPAVLFLCWDFVACCMYQNQNLVICYCLLWWRCKLFGSCVWSFLFLYIHIRFLGCRPPQMLSGISRRSCCIFVCVCVGMWYLVVCRIHLTLGSVATDIVGQGVVGCCCPSYCTVSYWYCND